MEELSTSIRTTTAFATAHQLLARHPRSRHLTATVLAPPELATVVEQSTLTLGRATARPLALMDRLLTPTIAHATALQEFVPLDRP